MHSMVIQWSVGHYLCAYRSTPKGDLSCKTTLSEESPPYSKGLIPHFVREVKVQFQRSLQISERISPSHFFMILGGFFGTMHR